MLALVLWERISLLFLERSNGATVAKPVVRVLAKLVERWHLPLCILLVDSGATMHAQLFDVLQLLSAHEDLLLRHFNDGTIEVLKEQPVHL